MGGGGPPNSPHRSGQAGIHDCIGCCRETTTSALPAWADWLEAFTAIGEDVGLSAVLTTKYRLWFLVFGLVWFGCSITTRVHLLLVVVLVITDFGGVGLETACTIPVPLALVSCIWTRSSSGLCCATVERGDGTPFLV